MLRPEPSRLPLLDNLEASLADRITEARHRTWLGEVAGLEQTLTALRAKKQHAERLAAAGIPTPRANSASAAAGNARPCCGALAAGGPDH